MKNFYLLFIYLFAVNISYGQICSVSQLPTNLQNGLVAYYPFCGNANDASGNGNNGTNYGATLTTDRFGNANSAYHFNGSSNYMTVLNSFLGGNQKNVFTIYARVYLNSISNSPNIWGKTLFWGEVNFLISSNGSVGLVWANSITGNKYSSIFSQPNILQSGSWYDIAIVFQNSIGQIYVNGQPITTSLQWSAQGGPILSTTQVESTCNFAQDLNSSRFGVRNTGGNWGNYLNGSIDDFKIYERALTSCEISQLYNENNNVVPNLQNFAGFNPLQDTTKTCGSSTTLDAGTGYSSYSWNTGSTTQTISPTNSGFYKVTVTNASGCTASDSTYLSLVYAKILTPPPTVCKGSSVTLSIDSTFNGNYLVCNSTMLPVNLQNGLVAFYPFCNSANDVSGNSNNGLDSNLTYGTDRFGKANSAGVFNSSYLSIPASSKFQPTSYTLSGWFNTSIIQSGVLGSNMDQTIVGYTPSNWLKAPSYKLYLDVTDNSILGSRQWTPSTSWQDILSLKGTISNNKWYHAVTTYDASSGLQKLYLNGTLYGTISSILQYNGQVAFVIGGGREQLSGNYAQFFKGKIDDVGFWSRTLSETEIQQLYTTKPTVSWSTGALTNSITVSPTQTTKYFVNVSDGITTCMDSVIVTVSNTDTSLTVLDPPSVCSNSGQVRLQAGIASSYQWHKNGVLISGATNQLYTATSTGFYKVFVTNNNGCVDSSRSVQITLNPQPLVSFTINKNSQCLTGNNFVFTNSSNISTGTLTYAWSQGDNTNSYTTNVTKNYTAIGSYNVRLIATSNNGCIDSSKATITVTTMPTVTISLNPSSSTICVGSSATLTASGASTYLWNSSETTSAITKSPPTTTTYTVTGTDANGCMGIASKTVTVNVLPTLSITSNPSSAIICNGASATLTASGASTYLWNSSETTAAITKSPSNTTTYSVTGTDANGCIASTSKLITVNPLPVFNPLQDTAKICGSITTLDAGLGYSSYLWNTGAITQTISPTASGFYKVTITNSSGCTASDSTYLSLVYAKILTPPPTICKGSSVILNLDSSFNNSNESLPSQTYNATFGNTWIHDFKTIVGKKYKLTVLGTWRIGLSPNQLLDAAYVLSNTQPTYAFNCGPTLLPSGGIWFKDLCIRPIPDVYNSSNIYNYYFTANSSNTTVGFSDLNNYGDNSGSLIFTLVEDRPLSIIWSTSEYTNSISVSPTQTTKYFVNVSDGITTCTDSIIVTVKNIPTINISPNPSNATICVGAPATLTATGASNYIWNSSETTAAITKSPTTTTTYTVTGTDANGCINTASQIITVNPLPTAIIQTPTSNNLCNGSTLTLTGSGGTTYNWYLNGTQLIGANSNIYNASQGGSYSLKSVSASGCISSVSSTVSLVQLYQPAVNFIYDRNCINSLISFTNSANISQSGTINYAWDFGDGATATLANATHTFISTGTYTVRLTVTPIACPLLSNIVSKSINIAAPQSNERYRTVNTIRNFSTPLSARNFGINYLWNPSVGLNNPIINSPLFNYNSTVNYTIAITDINGCVTTDSILLNVFNDVGVYVPKAFSPNGNGINDLLRPILVGIKSINNFSIYNRWGQLLYTTQTENAGWNGTFKGQAQPIETYTWTFEGVDYKGNIIRVSGKSTLLR